MKNEGWIYIGWDSKDVDYIKIGLTSDNNTYSRSHSSQNPDYGIELAIKVDNFNEVEKIIHNLFERKPFRKTKNKSEFCKTTLEKVFPLFLILANDVKIEDEKRGQTFIRVAEMVEDNLDQYKRITKPFVVNKINKLLKEGGVPVEDFYVEEEMPKEKPESKNQSTPQNRVCKYEQEGCNGFGGVKINWNLFFENNQQLVGKSVYPFKKVNEIGKFVKLKSPKRGAVFGILYKNREMSFNDFINENGSENRYNAYAHIYFLDTNKTIKETYEELKWK